MKTIGVIGLGSIGMRHAKNLREMGHHVWGYDTDMSKRTEFGFEYTSDPLRWKEVDGVVIAGPSDQHAVEALEGPPVPLFVEKPIGVSRGCLEILQMYPPKILMVGYNLRFHSCVKKAKEWIDAGRIGTPLWANFTLGQFSEKEPYLRDGVILNWSHELDLALYLLGPAVLAGSSTRLTDGKDDMTDILLTHKSGCRSTVHLDYLSKPEIRNHRIIGTEGGIEIELSHSRTATLVKGTKGLELADSLHGADTWNDNYIEEMQAFLDRIDGKETIGCTGAEALEVLKICLEVRRTSGA